MEEYEPILRQIRELEDKIRSAQAEIELIEAEMRGIEAEFPELTPAELRTIHPVYRSAHYRRLAHLSWISRWKKQIEELRKAIPPIKYIRLLIKFTIETGEGKEVPFECEVTADFISTPLTREEEEEIIRRVMNAAIKYFWILFDSYNSTAAGFKDWGKEGRLFPGSKSEHDTLCRWAVRLQKYLKEIDEEEMDRFLKAVIGFGGLARHPDEYVTREAIEKIGVSVELATEEMEPKYPRVRLTIEKKKPVSAYWERIISLADKTEINILKILDMEYERKEEETE